MCLSGVIAHADERQLLVVLHGLGGSINSRYMASALKAALSRGVSCLLLNTRGAGDSSGNVAHAGLIEDLALALAAESLAGYQHIYLLGYSMGGHVALRYACHDPDPRVRSVVALCSPLDLRASMLAFDRAPLSPYRRYVFGGLVESFARYAESGKPPISLSEARRIRHFIEWDERVIAPIFGFESAFAYYDQCSAARTLGSLKVPALYVGARQDPMVPYATVARALEAGGDALSVVWAAPGGHLAFPARFSLAGPTELSIEAQCLSWLEHPFKA
jgi:predicted alpha/beta-fold hydrolase